MKRKPELEIDLPWQMEILIVCASMIISCLAICCGWLALGMVVNTFVEGAFAGETGATPTYLSLTFAWPLLLAALIGISGRCYFAVRRAFIRRIESL